VKRILLVGAGHAHTVVLKSLREAPLHGARITLVSPRPRQLYSGMLPGVIAGHYRPEEAIIDVQRLAGAAHAEFVRGEVVWLDALRRTATLKDGRSLAYDHASLNAGSLVDTSVPGAAEHARPVKPLDAFAEGMVQELGAQPIHVAIAGGGAGGAEIAMALRRRGAVVTLYSEASTFPERLARRVAAVLRRTGVDFRAGMPVTALEPGPVVVSGPAQQAFDLVLWATGAAPLRWLASSGLETDTRGFVLVDATLRSVSHPEVFAVGDCATLRDAAHPRSGVYAVRHGEVLAHNLRATVAGGPLKRYRPQRRALMLLSCGERYAIASRGALSAQGWWVWRWKDWIDRRWVRSLSL
jgi:selenide,water dikinase